jgi:hypothetical protein
MRRSLLVLALSVASGLCASSALGQTDDEKNTARDFGKQGQDALDHGDAKTAEDRFHRAVQIFDNAKAMVPPTLLLGYARGAAKNNHFIAAEETYNRIIRAGLPPGAPTPFVKALEDAKREIDSVSPHIAHATISVGGCENPSVTLDGAALPSVVLGAKKPVDPGTHEVKATAPGCKAAAASFTVGDGAETTSSLTLEKNPDVQITTTPPPTTTPTTTTSAPTTNVAVTTTPGADTSSGGSGLRTAGFVTLSVGGAALILGAITGGIAIGQHSTLANECPGGNCPATSGTNDNGSLDSYHTTGAISTVGFIAGGVIAVVGLVMVLVAPSKGAHAASAAAKVFKHVTPFLGHGSLGAFGRF